MNRCRRIGTSDGARFSSPVHAAFIGQMVNLWDTEPGAVRRFRYPRRSSRLGVFFTKLRCTAPVTPVSASPWPDPFRRSRSDRLPLSAEAVSCASAPEGLSWTSTTLDPTLGITAIG